MSGNGDDCKSAYELEREARIHANQLMLAKLGLPSTLTKKPKRKASEFTGKKKTSVVSDTPSLPRRKSRRLQHEKADIDISEAYKAIDQMESKESHAGGVDIDVDVEAKYAAFADIDLQEDAKRPRNATYWHTLHRVRTLSEPKLRKRIDKIEGARGRWAVVKMRMFADALKSEGFKELASEALGALKRLLELPRFAKYKAAWKDLNLHDADEDKSGPGKLEIDENTPLKTGTTSPAAARSHVWMWRHDLDAPEDSKKAWKPYPIKDSDAIEERYLSKKRSDTFELNSKYSINFVTMLQFQTDDEYRQRAIKRVKNPLATTTLSLVSPPELQPVEIKSSEKSGVKIDDEVELAKKTEPKIKVDEVKSPQKTTKKQTVWAWKSDLDLSDSDSDAWTEYPTGKALAIEKAYQEKKDTIKLNAKYSINFGAMIQFQSKDEYRQRPIKRKAKDVSKESSKDKCGTEKTVQDADVDEAEEIDEEEELRDESDQEEEESEYEPEHEETDEAELGSESEVEETIQKKIQSSNKKSKLIQKSMSEPTTSSSHASKSKQVTRSNTYTWVWKQNLDASDSDSDAWAEYPQGVVETLESAFTNKKKDPLVKLGKKYSADLETMVQFQRADEYRQRPIKRKLSTANIFGAMDAGSALGDKKESPQSPKKKFKKTVAKNPISKLHIVKPEKKPAETKTSMSSSTPSSISFKVELASNGRSKCKKSKESIEKGELRIGKISPSPFKEGAMMTAWYKVGPFFEMQLRQRKTTKKVEKTSDLRGFDSLCVEDQETVEKALKFFLENKDKPTKSKKRKSSQGKRTKSPRDSMKKAKIDSTESKAGVPAKSKSSVEKPASKTGEIGNSEQKVADPFKGMDPTCSPREAATSLLNVARELGFPVPEDERQARIRCGQMVMGNKKGGGGFNLKKALKALAKELNCMEKLPGTKIVKKKRTAPEAKCGDNQGLVDAFWDLREFEFKRMDKMKAIAYLKVSKALAAVSYKIESGKKVSTKGKHKLPGVGKASGDKIDEFLSSGKIDRLERFRRGDFS